MVGSRKVGCFLRLTISKASIKQKASILEKCHEYSKWKYVYKNLKSKILTPKPAKYFRVKCLGFPNTIRPNPKIPVGSSQETFPKDYAQGGPYEPQTVLWSTTDVQKGLHFHRSNRNILCSGKTNKWWLKHRMDLQKQYPCDISSFMMTIESFTFQNEEDI